MKYISHLILVLTLWCVSFASFHVLAAPLPNSEPGFVHETPLMVIRFNNPHVDYAMPLYTTLSRALEIKPSSVFDIVSIAPRAHEDSNQAYYNRTAEQNSHKVLSTLHEIGLPPSRISLVNAIDSVDASEVRIYVH